MLVSLIATDALWSTAPGTGSSGGGGGGVGGGGGPYIVGRFLDRGQDAFAEDDTWLRQDQQGMPGAPDLDAGATNPRGYWNGGVRRARRAGVCGAAGA